MTPEQIYDYLGKLLGCFLKEDCYDDSDCNKCPYGIGDPFKLIQAAREIIGQMQWIPVTERLPELLEGHSYSADVLATVQQYDGSEKTAIATYSERFGWLNDEDDYFSATAWMSLPEPYQKGDAE